MGRIVAALTLIMLAIIRVTRSRDRHLFHHCGVPRGNPGVMYLSQKLPEQEEGKRRLGGLGWAGVTKLFQYGYSEEVRYLNIQYNL
jgi:hypothetical protein